MKKLLFLIISLLILGLIFAGCNGDFNLTTPGTTGTEGIVNISRSSGLSTIDLIAGQDDPGDIGDVEIWNDENNLYVKYIITDTDWCITETHVHVGNSLGDFPLTKKGNPKVGHFKYSKDDHNCVFEYTEEIPLAELTWEEDNEVLIAAHAVVKKTITGTIIPDLDWKRSAEPTINFYEGYGAAWIPTQAFAIPLDPNQIVWDNGTYYNNGISDVREWASWKYASSDPDGGTYNGYSDLRRFQATFTIPEGYSITAGSLYALHYTSGIPINDNVYIFVNGSENLLFWGGTRVYTGEISNSFLGVTGRAAIRGSAEPKETDRWYIPGTIPDVMNFESGQNTIDIFTEENERWGGMGKLMLDLDYEQIITETAWAEGIRFVDKGNWATYFTYTIQEVLIEAVSVPSDGIQVCSTEILESGQEYRLEASGTYTFVDWADAGIADAKCSKRINPYIPSGYTGDPAWVLGEDLSIPHALEVQIDTKKESDIPDPGWLSKTNNISEFDVYNKYHVSYTGTGNTVCFYIYDTNYNDNSGDLTVDIYWLP